jgi:hypothetical protein
MRSVLLSVLILAVVLSGASGDAIGQQRWKRNSPTNFMERMRPQINAQVRNSVSAASWNAYLRSQQIRAAYAQQQATLAAPWARNQQQNRPVNSNGQFSAPTMNAGIPGSPK